MRTQLPQTMAPERVLRNGSRPAHSVREAVFGTCQTHPYTASVIAHQADFRSDWRYELRELMGVGATASVYAAVDVTTDQTVAIKLPHEATVASNLIIKHEYRIARRLRDMGTVQPLGMSHVNGRLALVMQLLRGPAFTQYIRGNLAVGELPCLERLRAMLIPLTRTLVALHRNGWVHGDLKPGHVGWNDTGVPVWMDVETACRVDAPFWTLLQRRQQGTFMFLAPEAIASQQPQTASDIFSLGRMVAFGLLGRLPSWDPFQSEAECDCRIISQLPKETPWEWAMMCVRMMRQEPARRPTAAEVLDWLLAWEENDQIEPIAVVSTDSAKKHAKVAEVVQLATAPQEPPRTRSMVVKGGAVSIDELEGALLNAPGNRPRLVLTAACNANHERPLGTLDDIFMQLCEWLSAAPTDLQKRFKPACGEALKMVCPELMSVFDSQTQLPQRRHTQEELEQATHCLVRLIETIARERRVIILLECVEQLDPVSGRLLNQLIALGGRSDVVLIALPTTTRNARSNATTRTLLRGAKSI